MEKINIGRLLAGIIFACEEIQPGVMRPDLKAMLEAYSREHMRLVLGWPDGTKNE